MRKLSEIKGEEALDVLAEIIEPAAEIFTDENVKNALRGTTLSALPVNSHKHKCGTPYHADVMYSVRKHTA